MKILKRIISIPTFVFFGILCAPIFIFLVIFKGVDKANNFMDKVLLPISLWMD